MTALSRNEIIMLGDLNTGGGNEGTSNLNDRYGEDIINGIGERLLDLCESLGFICS